MPLDRPRRLGFALSLRAFLALILAFGLWLGRWVNGAREQRAIVAAIQDQGFSSARYDDDSSIGDLQGDVDVFRGVGRPARPTGSWRLMTWLERTLGRDFFHNVIEVQVGGDAVHSFPLTHEEVIALVVKLPRLRALALPTLRVTDEDARRIARLTTLRHLHLSDQPKALTDDGLRALGTLTNLETLDARGDFSDQGLAALCGLLRLESVSITYHPSDSKSPARMTGVGFARWADLPRLRSLHVALGSLNGEGMKALGSLTQLEKLEISGGTFADEDLRSLANLRRLKALRLNSSPIDGTGFRFLGGLSRLSTVSLGNCRNVTDPAIPHLARLPALEYLCCNATQVTAPALEQLRAVPRLGRLSYWPMDLGAQARLQEILPRCWISRF